MPKSRAQLGMDSELIPNGLQNGGRRTIRSQVRRSVLASKWVRGMVHDGLGEEAAVNIK